MRTVTYKSVFEGGLRMRSEDPATATTSVKAAFAEFVNQGLSDCHEFWRWPELVTIEGRYFRDTYAAATTYAATNEVYFPATQLYYRALRAATGQAPASLSAGVYVTNEAYWWECSQEIAGDDWADTTGYIVGDVRRDPVSGNFYACFSAHTSSGTIDTSKFGLLAAFRPYVAYEQTGATAIEAVVECWDADPRSDAAAGRVAFRKDIDGVRFAADQAGPVWVEFRVRCPDFWWSAEWSAISFTSGTIVYHTASGEVYQASSAATSGDVPGVAAKWVKRDVPYTFRHAAKWKAVALALLADSQDEKALILDNNDPAKPGKFQDALEEQVWQYTKLQGQTGRLNTVVPKT